MTSTLAVAVFAKVKFAGVFTVVLALAQLLVLQAALGAGAMPPVVVATEA